MFLKSLVIRGFKSFADKTTLVFEPGITIVVGPNGSGKSNIVDAISWVLGEQGPRSLRGGKMEDVIFAGSRLRPALAMAEVTMTIDNSAGLLSIGYSEVTISRILFRSGDSEYRLNGNPCRLLDIQEVLSDTGIGREQHTIIGQGQLDAVLSADPMQMRSLIEEAAGVAKHQRRKDRALRKISGTEQNLVRLSDLLSEVRRQLRPLREQAEVAKRYTNMSDELGRFRLIAAARELADVRGKLGRGEQLDVDALIRVKETALTDMERELTEVESLRDARMVEIEMARSTSWRLARSAERFESLGRLAAERLRTIEAELAATTEAAAQARLAEINAGREALAGELAVAVTEEESAASMLHIASQDRERSAAELAARVEELTPLRNALRRSTDDAMRMRSEIAATSGSLKAAESERGRLDVRAAELQARVDEAARRRDEQSEAIGALESGEAPLLEGLELESLKASQLEAAHAEALSDFRRLDRESAAWRARGEVRGSSSALDPKTLEALRSRGAIGPLSALIEVPTGMRAAVEALAGDIEGVLLVRDAAAVEQVAAGVPDDRAIGLLVAGARSERVDGLKRLIDQIRVLDVAVEDALSNVYIADSIEEAARDAQRYPQAIFVTREGALASGHVVTRGPADAAARAAEFESEAQAAELKASSLEGDLNEARTRVQGIVDRLNGLDAGISAAAEHLAATEREFHALERELVAVREAGAERDSSRIELGARLQQLERDLPGAESKIAQTERGITESQEAHARASAAHASATSTFEEARVRLEVVRRGAAMLRERDAGLERAASDAARAADGVEGRRTELNERLARARAVASEAHVWQAEAQRWATSSEEEYERSHSSLQTLDARVNTMRETRREAASSLDEMRIRARQEDLGLSETRIRGRILEERIREEWQWEPDQAVARYGHIWEVEDPSTLPDPLDRVAAMNEESFRRRQTRLERDLSEMGKVNPLAAQEYESLTEREAFLADQIADVRSSRRDLFKVIQGVDDKVKEMFASAFEDVSRGYERLFAVLFPGGTGRLRLTDPSDLLATGVEVEARPGGKNLKRLSLLSGGEKALSALAVLFAIFRARPSPFYVLDEVEAALDDVNLHRFLGLLREFRETSQLLVVTHQKRTMEAADVLYGVSIRPDGSTRVISERLTESSPAPESVQGRVPNNI